MGIKVIAILCGLIVATQAATEQEILSLGYKLIPGIGYYKIHTTPSTWEEGQSICIEEGGHLAEYNSEEEADKTGEYMESLIGRNNCFIGFHALYSDNTAELVTGVPINQTGNRYYIDAQNNNRVGSSYPGGWVYWNPRDRTGPFMCERELWHTYDAYKGQGYYKLHTEPKTWVEAFQTCVNEGAHLAVVNSKKEAKILQNMLKKNPNLDRAHDNTMVNIGYHMQYDVRDVPDKKKQYRTVQGGSLDFSGYTKWASGQPKSGKVNHCGAFTRDGQLYMSQCNKTMAFICEKDI